MDIAEFHARRAEKLRQLEPRRRELCTNCLQPHLTCYCRHLQPFETQIKFAILTHRLEVRRRIATGRMAHLILKNSKLLMGYDFSKNQELDNLINDPNYSPVVL